MPWSRFLSEKLRVPQLVKKFPTLYGTQRLATTFTSTCYLYLSSASSIQSIPAHSTFWRSILIFSFHLCLGLLSSLFPSGLPTNIMHAPLLSPIHATCTTHLIIRYKTQHNLNNYLSQFNFSIVMLHHLLVERCRDRGGACGLHCQV